MRISIFLCLTMISVTLLHSEEIISGKNLKTPLYKNNDTSLFLFPHQTVSQCTTMCYATQPYFCSCLLNTQKILNENLKLSIKIQTLAGFRTNYASVNSTLSNIDIIGLHDISLEKLHFSDLFPYSLSRIIWRKEKLLIKMYLSSLHFINSLNPIPGYSFSIISRSPAVPYIFIQTLNQLKFDLRTYPFLDDEKIKVLSPFKRSIGFSIIMTLY